MRRRGINVNRGSDPGGTAGRLLSGFRDQWFLLPNLVTYVRGLLLPVFVVLLAVDSYGWALVTLAVIGLSDWVDGYLARRLGLVSRLGQCLDPLFDRVGVIVIVVSCAAFGLVPWWFAGVLVTPELVLGCLVLIRPQAGRILRPTRIGKLRTALLLTGFPLLILAAPPALDSPPLTVTAGVLLALGAAGHLVAGAQYGWALLVGSPALEARTPAP
ncbi:CDP-alcohol phosphatidyltransferase family protein [Leifsonia shinshuensis]|uniref:CDP-alcohol phosphatidyltransferase family protein n=1 Tax=Leifsonia shinshuensis TaxID=150026 RepID=UPI001F5083D5|nr:CDP-alcohol phosphatidyltransferase family protein [Leifsonia shinshuensis]MCI0156067.1 CDP-alcohol phosphatidyltransferase family protein [Leifsonia shinshuensis]